ncbi:MULTISPECIES: hypothetical protein [unclassified Frankia]|uniref:hypothetical protein n=1 Tax=unclassified Frankia TaxID=2632575 RepID=UPI002AD540EE|nr:MULTISPECIES: hypothetical protein [unclassified Frankia]
MDGEERNEYLKGETALGLLEMLDRRLDHTGYFATSTSTSTSTSDADADADAE